MAETNSAQPAGAPATEPAPAAVAVAEPVAPAAAPTEVPAEVTAASRGKQTAEDISFPVDQEILDVMNHDPFPGGELPPEEKGAAEAVPSQQPSEQKPGEPAIPAEGGAAAPAATPAAPATTPAVPAAPAPMAVPENVALQAQVTSLQAALARMQSQQTQPAQQPAAQKPAEKPDFMFNVPDQLIQLMGSEDPSQVRQGVQALMAGLGQSIHGIVMEAVDAKFASVPSMITQGQEMLAQKQNIFDDFYKAHPDLNQPALHSIIANVGAQVQAEMGLHAWSPQLRDAIAVRVRQSLGQIQGATQVAAPAALTAVPVPAPAPAPVATPVPVPPAMIGSGVSPAPAPSGDALARDIVDTLFG